MKPKLIIGNCHSDQRGNLFYNNNFDVATVKRIYVIENSNTDLVRAWQGHKIEQRWFSAIQGSFEIKLIAVDDWEKPSLNLKTYTFVLNSNSMNVLHIPKGFVNSIQALEKKSKLLVMSDYYLGEIKDEYRFEFDYFKL